MTRVANDVPNMTSQGHQLPLPDIRIREHIDECLKLSRILLGRSIAIQALSHKSIEMMFFLVETGLSDRSGRSFLLQFFDIAKHLLTHILPQKIQSLLEKGISSFALASSQSRIAGIQLHRRQRFIVQPRFLRQNALFGNGKLANQSR